ncbi:MAG: hypothetical protein KJ718_04340 [Nanoarchaeota archaeon]|nr:hypothetical protein [Nanoarchaeota archaeon]MBU1051758.1 hypothetical protein [Nanoarchaeota archaeon]MBU1988361.1 hypothetical protein [Nanoarchaeota archaeon]
MGAKDYGTGDYELPSRLVEKRIVVSEPGAAIRVVELTLTEEARRALSTGVEELPKYMKKYIKPNCG